MSITHEERRREHLAHRAEFGKACDAAPPCDHPVLRVGVYPHHDSVRDVPTAHLKCPHCGCEWDDFMAPWQSPEDDAEMQYTCSCGGKFPVSPAAYIARTDFPNGHPRWPRCEKCSWETRAKPVE